MYVFMNRIFTYSILFILLLFYSSVDNTMYGNILEIQNNRIEKDHPLAFNELTENISFPKMLDRYLTNDTQLAMNNNALSILSIFNLKIENLLLRSLKKQFIKRQLLYKSS
jgi:hypothetical protein